MYYIKYLKQIIPYVFHGHEITKGFGQFILFHYLNFNILLIYKLILS